MPRRHCIPLLVLLTALTPACFTPVPQEDCPVRDDPLFRSVVWIHTPGAWGTGVIVHSSDRGTYVLTAAHVAADDDGNSGSPIFVDGRVVGLCTSECLSPGPKLLREFFRENQEIPFQLEEPRIAVPPGD